jgi:hypothetical protein
MDSSFDIRRSPDDKQKFQVKDVIDDAQQRLKK